MVALATRTTPTLCAADVKASADCRLFYQQATGRGKRSGKALLAHVPWRDDHNPSLNVYADGWVDRATGERGDIFSLAQRLYSHLLTFQDALHYVAGWIGASGSLKLSPIKPRQEIRRNDGPPSAEWQSIAEAVIKDCERRLWTPAGAAALDYLHNRGLTDDTIRALRLGFNPSWQRTDWIKPDGQFAKLAPGVTMPWIAGGRIWAIKVRSLDPNVPKSKRYIQLSGGNQDAGLFNADAIQPGKPVLIVEGEFDAALIAQFAGDLVTPVTVGSASNGIAERWKAQLDQTLIVLALDNDKAGNAARDRLTAQFPSARIAPALPDEIKDVTDYWKAGGDVRQWVIDTLATATPIPTPGDQAVTSAPASWPADLPKAIDDLWTTLKLAKSPIILLGAVLRAIAAGKLSASGMTRKDIAEATGLTESAIRNGLDKDKGVLFSAPSRLSSNSACTIPIQPKAENDESLHTAKFPHRPTQIITLNPVAVAIQNILDRIVTPYAKMKIFSERSTKRYAPPDLELLKAAGLPADDLALLTDNLVYPPGNAEGERLLAQTLAKWRARLSDLTPLELPALPDDMPIKNGRCLRAAKVAAAAMPHTEDKISLDAIAKTAGVSRRAVSDLLPFAGVGMTENIDYVPVGDQLPAPDYAPDREGFPAKLRYVNADGEICHLSYAKYDAEHRRYRIDPAAQRIAIETKAAGRPVEVGYRQAGTPYRMDTQERQAALAQRAAEHRERKPGNQTPRQKQETPPRHDGPGYSTDYALAWRNALPDHLPAAIAERYRPEVNPMYSHDAIEDRAVIDQGEGQFNQSSCLKPLPPVSAETRAALLRLENERREAAHRRLNPHLYAPIDADALFDFVLADIVQEHV